MYIRIRECMKRSVPSWRVSAASSGEADIMCEARFMFPKGNASLKKTLIVSRLASFSGAGGTLPLEFSGRLYLRVGAV